MAVTIGVLIALVLSGCQVESGYPKPFSGYEQIELSTAEKEQVIEDIKAEAIGRPYKWGSDTVQGGFDCSGLIQWAFRHQGFGEFRNGDEVFDEITAHNLYHHNSVPQESLNDLKHGDMIFFDENGDGHITHNAVFDRYDSEADEVWVYDAYSVAGEVSHRVVEDFEAKGPLYGRPLKTVRR